MCVVSAMIDYGKKLYPDSFPTQLPITIPTPFFPQPVQPSFPTGIHPNVDWKEQVDHLQKYLDLLKQAREFDKVTNQPHCEDKSKVEFLKTLHNDLEKIWYTLDDTQEKFHNLLGELENFINEYEENA